ncbi:hypothetical protein ULG90_02275 [Halopseudomonas pachastrellae]|nr:hypothetical protein ULG90_02275 [Halopseudomonas pachastrellae]
MDTDIQADNKEQMLNDDSPRISEFHRSNIRNRTEIPRWLAAVQDRLHRDAGGPAWHDDRLLRLGAMDPLSMGLMVREWEVMGFQIERKVKGESRWNHGCIIGAGECAPTLPCAWLMVADDGMSARMKPGHPYETNLNKRS